MSLSATDAAPIGLADLFGRRGPPVVLQAEAAECGLACLAMVAAAYGQQHSLSELRRRFSASLKGTSLRGLMDMADALGLSSRALRVDLEDLTKLKRPAILHWNLNHYVVLKQVSGDKAVLHDPASGLRVLTLDEVGRHFTGVALELTPTPDFVKKPVAERLRLGDLFSQTRGLVPAVAQLFVLAAGLQVLALLSPMLSQMVVDDVLAKGDLDLLLVVCVGMALILAISIAIDLLRGYVGLYLGTQLSFQMQSNLLRHALRLPGSWFEKRHIGDILSRFASLGPAQSVFTSSAISIVLDGIMAVAALIMMCLYAPLLTAIEIAALLAFFVARLAVFPYLRRKTDEGLHLSARVQTTFLETLRGARMVKLFGLERERVSHWQTEQAQAVNNGVQIARFGLWNGAGHRLVSGLQQVVVWALGAKMVIDGRISLGALLAFQAYTSQFTAAVGNLIDQVFAFKTLDLHLERLADVVHADPERGIEAPIQPDRRFDGAVAVRALSFRYADHEPWIIRDASFAVAPGELACFMGPSGQGKTTLLKLLIGFHDPQEGEVLVDDTPLRTFGVRTFRDRIGVVMQDDQLLRGSIADNIACFDPTIDMAKVEAAAALARVHDEILRLPMGYASLVGDLGSTLSSGQRQRVLLARALYRDPKVLFLDEGTANLDPDNERGVMESLAGLAITRIVIAHREAALAGADRLFVVKDGKIVEQV
jgi:ATP-binding cassette subfamily B protein RaxB